MICVAGPGFVRRMSEEIKRVVGRIVAWELKDPRVGMACVVAVDLTADLGHATIFVRVVGDEEESEETLTGLRNATGHIRHELAERCDFRYVPELSFELDRTMEHAERIEKLIEAIHRDEAEEMKIEDEGETR